MKADIAGNVKRIKEEVAKAALDAGRDPSEIRILAATKYTDRSGVEEIIRAGINLIGENRVQDATAKLGATDDGSQPDIHELFPDVKLHMIGHLQSNKVNHALRLFDLVETVDRLSLTKALEKRLKRDDRILPIMVEVKLTGEETKTGCSPGEVESLLEYTWTECPHLQVRGLMGMGPWDPDPEVARPYYNQLKCIFERVSGSAPPQCHFNVLSMGMSADFKVGIQEGSTLVRIGRALFS